MPDVPVIVIDTREQRPYTFAGMETVRKTLETGDYSLEGFEHLVAVERKSKGDAWGCTRGGRRRFDDCVERLGRLHRAVIVVECSFLDYLVPPAYIEFKSDADRDGSIARAVNYYISRHVKHGVATKYCPTRSMAERFVVRFLMEYYRHFGHLRGEP